ncbi:hypothetical protein ACJRO7_016069 [Eucalyptus globulus]|uniref:Retrotransposon gag domain-containing protein n=1 Tax=Eucalyptus globulus TaxID=34317 RepID=A0ABD3L5V6_EUCGL
MENEDTRVRVINMENQMAQMMTLLADLSSQVKNLTSTSSTMNIPTAPPEVPVVEPMAKRPVEEIPTAIPIVIGTEPPSKEISTSHFDEENARRLAKIEERLCMLQGYQLQGFDKLSPFTKITVPEFYKEPEFTRKYDGIGCPKTHLKYYLGKMARYSDNPPLLINSFQDSLVGPALTWFIELDMEKVRTWEDLVDEFLQQYKFNTEIAPTREELVRVEKRRTESFRAYAQRWRVIASQVKPPLSEKETMKLLLQAMPRDFFEKMYNHTCMNFATFVELGERIEGIMREGRLMENTNRRYNPKRDKESAVEIAYIQNSFSQKPYNLQAHKLAMEVGGSSRNFERKGKAPQRQFTPLPRPMSQLLPMLIENHLVAKEIPRYNPPKFVGFDLNKTCEYHMGEKGHHVDNCLMLRYKIQDLLDKKLLTFKDSGPNVQQNPLPKHSEDVNMVGAINGNEEPIVPTV